MALVCVCQNVRHFYNSFIYSHCFVQDLLEKNILTNDAYLGDEKEIYEHQVFYYKMKGDYLRYVAEVLLDDKEERKSEKQ